MQNKYAELRSLTWELTALPSEEVVKVAGVLQKIKKFFKKIVDPVYRREIEDFEVNTLNLQQSSAQLQQALKHLENSIGAGDLEKYKENFDLTKELTLKVLHELRNLNQKGELVQSIIEYYTDKELAQSDFVGKLKQQMPAEFDLEFGPQAVSFTSYNWLSSTQPSDIQIRGGEKSAENRFFQEIGRIVKDFNLIPLEQFKAILTGKKEELVNNFKQAIIAGTIRNIHPKKPSAEVKNVRAGIVEITIDTVPFKIPDTNIYLTCTVEIVDARATNPERALSLKSTLHMAPARGTRAELWSELIKQAEELPYKITTLSDLDLATVLREGYKQAFGNDPTAEALAGGWAQVILEAGRPVKLPDNNFGNIKAGTDWINSGKPYFVKSTKENDKAGKQYTETGTKWRAYNTPVEGAAGYWGFLGRGYKEALDWMAAGDPTSGSVALGMKGYYTANIQKYAKGVGSLYQEFMTSIAPKLAGLKSLPVSEPGEKPMVKNWSSEYSKEEKQAALGHSSAVQAPPSETSPNEVDQLINTLYADGELTTLVKLATAGKILPTTTIQINLTGSRAQQIKYKQAFSQLMPLIQGEMINELMVRVVGMPLTVLSAVQGLSDCIIERAPNLIATASIRI